MEVDTTLVHAAHCCAKHGCKYSINSLDCPVEQGAVKAEYPCEFCDMDDEAAAPVVDRIVAWLEARITELDAQEQDRKQAAYVRESAGTRANHYKDVVRGLREGAWKA